ncbi:MAG TPA: hypothetical protein VK174_17230 [Chitinophagales bacterium]|nr:hypothetical protein [Chitinophagales bacterium]
MNLILRGVGIFALFVVGFFVFGFVTMHLWNYVMPYLFKLPLIDFKMAMAMVILSKILFGGMHMRPEGGWGQKKYWKAKWQSMTPEEREKFKADFALRCQSKWGKGGAKTEVGNA